MEQLRAVFYCRVSTEEEHQASSVINQKQESVNAIRENHWILVDQYIDEGKSGTTVLHRDAYNRLFRDMETDKWDIVVIKSQDRLMRNTREWYLFIDRLIRYNKKLYFYLERKFYHPDDALLTGIRAILAEEFSRSLSKNINNAHRKRQESGSSVIITSRTWGYDKVHKQVVVNEQEAEMIRFIFEMSAQNHGSRVIAKMLETQGYRNREGNRIADQTVRRIIRNPLYKGTVVMNKSHKDFETKRTEPNSPEKWIYHDNLVPPIVDARLWDHANQQMDTHSREVLTEDFCKKRLGSKRNLSYLSGRIVCGLCGNVYWRRSTKLADGSRQYSWSCSEYVLRGRTSKSRDKTEEIIGETNISVSSGCDNIHIKESEFHELLTEIAQSACTDAEETVTNTALRILRHVLVNDSEYKNREKQLEEDIRRITQNREKLLDKFLEDQVSEDLYQIKEQDYKDALAKINEELQSIKDLYGNPSSNNLTRLKQLEKDVQELIKHDLTVHKIQSHIHTVNVQPDQITLSFGTSGKILAEVRKISCHKTEYHILSVCAHGYSNSTGCSCQS